MKSLKSFSTLAVSIFAIVFSQPAFSKKAKALSLGAKKANYTARLLNRYKNVGQFIQIFEPHVKPQDFTNLKQALKAERLFLRTAMPKFKAKGSKVMALGASDFIDFKSKKRLSINGVKFVQANKTPAESFKHILNKLQKNKKRNRKTSLLDLFFPKAYAFSTGQSLLALVGSGGLGAFAGSRFFENNGALKGGALGVGGFFVANELYQSVRKGSVSCSRSGEYRFRRKGRNDLFIAQAEFETIDPEVLQEVGVSGNCTKDNANRLEEAFKRFGRNPNRARRVQAPTATPSASGIIF